MSVTKMRSSGLRAMKRTRLRPCAAILMPKPSGRSRSNDFPLASVMWCVAASNSWQLARAIKTAVRARFTREKLTQLSDPMSGRPSVGPTGIGLPRVIRTLSPTRGLRSVGLRSYDSFKKSLLKEHASLEIIPGNFLDVKVLL